jgi:hypothetical protein
MNPQQDNSNLGGQPLTGTTADLRAGQIPATGATTGTGMTGPTAIGGSQQHVDTGLRHGVAGDFNDPNAKPSLGDKIKAAIPGLSPTNTTATETTGAGMTGLTGSQHPTTTSSHSNVMGSNVGANTVMPGQTQHSHLGRDAVGGATVGGLAGHELHKHEEKEMAREGVLDNSSTSGPMGSTNTMNVHSTRPIDNARGMSESGVAAFPVGDCFFFRIG